MVNLEHRIEIEPQYLHLLVTTVFRENTGSNNEGSTRPRQKMNFTTLDSGIDVVPGINVAHGTFGKNIKRSP